MDRINTASKAVDLFGVGKHGWKNRNIATGVEPTDFNAEWCNGVQEELLSMIEGAGVVPDTAVRTQVRQAIKRLFGGNVTTVNFAGSPFALTADHAGMVLVDASAGNVVINFPAANIFAALAYRFKRIDATANTITFNRSGADTFDGGATSVYLSGLHSVISLIGDGVSVWRAVGTQRGLARFVANGNFVVPPGVTTIYVSAVAGGGGGGGGGRRPTTSEYAGGGGGGNAGQAVIRAPYASVPGETISITVGAGGAGGATTAGADGSPGTAGGSTAVGALLTLTPGSGSGGGGQAGGGSPGANGFPRGSFGIDGTGTATGAGTGNGGTGASSSYGGGGGLGRSDAGASAGGFAGFAAGGFGAGGGGGGCGTNGVGGAGSPGMAIIEW